MCELKKNGKVFTSKFVGTGPSSYEKRIYRAAVSQRLRNIGTKNPSLHYFHLRNIISNAAFIKVTSKIVTSEQVKVTFLSTSHDTTVPI